MTNNHTYHWAGASSDCIGAAPVLRSDDGYPCQISGGVVYLPHGGEILAADLIVDGESVASSCARHLAESAVDIAHHSHVYGPALREYYS